MEEFWNFSKRERLGILGIASIIILLFIANIFVKSEIKNDPVALSEFKLAIDSFEIQKVVAEKEKKKYSYPSIEKKNKSKEKYSRPSSKSRDNNTTTIIPESRTEEFVQPVLEKFNPNLAGKAQLVSLGIPERTANTIINFRNKGGKFFKAEDLKIVYGFKESLFETLKDYIDIPVEARKEVYTKPKKIQRVDINLATEEEWMELRGIGPFLSSQIITYREKLGGFYDSKQIAEVYGLPDSTFQSILPFLITSSSIQKLNINNLNFKQLIAHPYISKSTAGQIITYLDRNGKFNTWEEFEKNIKFTPKELDNIKQYFTIQ